MSESPCLVFDLVAEYVPFGGLVGEGYPRVDALVGEFLALKKSGR